MTRLDESDREQVEVVFVTTDPERDTGRWSATTSTDYDPEFIGVTGELADIEEVAASVGVGMGEKLPSGGYEVDAHTTHVTGIDVGDEAPIYWPQDHLAVGVRRGHPRACCKRTDRDDDGDLPLSIPSPSDGVWYLGPVPLRGYALAIILGIIAAIWISERRWVARGGTRGEISDLAVWAVPFGLVGARLYHVATDPDRYFGADGSPWEILYVWQGGLGVWGGIAMGALGVVVGAKLKGIRLLPVLDAMAPSVLVAQALGRWGNWFNQELFGKPTDLPWALEIDSEHLPGGHVFPTGTTFHPTFLYEFLWCLAAFAVIVWLDRRMRLGHGRVLALVRDGLHARPRLDRDAAHRHRPARRRRRPAPQRVDLDRAVPARHRLVRLRRTPLAGARGEPLRRRPEEVYVGMPPAETEEAREGPL